MLQNNYGWTSQKNVPGGLVDSSPRSIISRANGEDTAIKFGYGVVRGDNPGVDVLLPTTTSTSELFEGVVASGIAEHDLAGNVYNNPTKVLGLLEWGKIWVRVPDDLVVAYGDPLYLIIDGDDLGKFTNVDTDAIQISGIFIGPVDSDDIAPVRIYDAPVVVVPEP